MKLSELSIEQMSRWIAEKKEPNPASMQKPQWHVFVRSPGWSGSGTYIPRLITEPEIAMRLLKSLDCEIQTRINDGVTIRLWMKDKSEFKDLWISGEIEIAIAQAYMLANGYKEETQ